MELPERRQEMGARVCGQRSMAENFSAAVGQGQASGTPFLKNGRARSRRSLRLHLCPGAKRKESARTGLHSGVALPAPEPGGRWEGAPSRSSRSAVFSCPTGSHRSSLGSGPLPGRHGIQPKIRAGVPDGGAPTSRPGAPPCPSLSALIPCPPHCQKYSRDGGHADLAQAEISSLQLVV